MTYKDLQCTSASMNTTFLNNLGNSYRLAGDLEQAESILLKSLDLDSNGILTQFSLGILYKTQGNISKAIKSFQNSIQVNPQYTEAYYQLAATHLKAKNKESAKLSIQKGLKVDPDNKKFKKLYEQVVAS